MLLEHGERAARLAWFIIGQAGIKQNDGGGREARSQPQGFAEVGLAAVAVAGLDLGFAPQRQGHGVIGTKAMIFRGCLEEVLRAAGLVVPLGQLLPAPDVIGIDGDERPAWAGWRRRSCRAAPRPRLRGLAARWACRRPVRLAARLRALIKATQGRQAARPLDRGLRCFVSPA